MVDDGVYMQNNTMNFWRQIAVRTQMIVTLGCVNLLMHCRTVTTIHWSFLCSIWILLLHIMRKTRFAMKLFFFISAHACKLSLWGTFV